MKVVVRLIGLILLTVGAVSTGHFIAETARLSTAQNDIAAVSRFQEQFSKAIDNLYAPSLEAMTRSEFGNPLTLTIGSTVSYLVNEAGDQYVFAVQLADGSVVVGSGAHTMGATCSAYTPGCVAKVTTDEVLIAAAPMWSAYTPSVTES